MIVKFVILFLVFCATSFTILNAQNAEDSDTSTLLRIAREFRYGASHSAINIPRAVHFYEYVIERTSGKELGEVVWELYQVLDKHVDIRSKYSQWELIVKAAEEGQPDAQHIAAASYATGIFKEGLVPQDPTRSLLLEYFSALSGNPRAHVGMGYRYLNGIGVKESCERALPFYEFAANHAIQFIEENGYMPIIDKTHISDGTQTNSNWMRQEVTHELTDYYAHLAESGDTAAATMLGNIYNMGSRIIPIDQEKAIYFLSKAAKQNYPAASGLLGYILAKKMFRENRFANALLDVDDKVDEFSPVKVFEMLKVASNANDANGLVGLGYVYLHGIGVAMNATRAIEYFQRAMIAHPDAGFYLGEILTKKVFQAAPANISPQKLSSGVRSQDLAVAIQAYSSSAQLGNMLSQHRLGHLTSKGLGVPRSCENAISSFKSVAERGFWSLDLNEAHKRFVQRDYLGSLFMYSQLAAIGLESAQSNAAYLLTNKVCPAPIACKTCHTNVSSKSSALPSQTIWEKLQQRLLNSTTAVKTKKTFQTSTEKSWECEARSLSLLGLSASHGNSESFVLIGDFYYYGFAGLVSSRLLSTLFYQKAADLHSTQAIFNLGLMHEIGDGVAQDFHLAKRYYDLAAEVDPKAKVPRDIALFVMEVHRSLLSFEGFEYLEQIPEVQQFLTKCKETLLYLLELLQYADAYIRDYLDDYTITSTQAMQTLQQKLTNTVPPPVKVHGVQLLETIQYLYRNVLANVDSIQGRPNQNAHVNEVSGSVVEELTKLGILIVILAILFWIKKLRARNLGRN